MDGGAEGFNVVRYISCSQIGCVETGTTYTLVTLTDDSSAVTGTLSCTMKYRIRQCDPDTGQPKNAEEQAYPDEFVV
jgi:coatomer protein complex subunit gamma